MEAKPCACGGKPIRERRRTKAGMRFRLKCAKCGRKTRWHRPSGGDLQEWNGGAE